MAQGVPQRVGVTAGLVVIRDWLRDGGIDPLAQGGDDVLQVGRQGLQQVGGGLGEQGALTQQSMAAASHGVMDGAGQGEDLAPDIGGKPGGGAG